MICEVPGDLGLTIIDGDIIMCSASLGFADNENWRLDGLETKTPVSTEEDGFQGCLYGIELNLYFDPDKK